MLGEQLKFVDTLVWTACLAPPLFTEAMAPLSKLVSECGLARHESRLAPPGCDHHVEFPPPM